MIKILFLIHDLGQGGAEKVLVNLVNNMDSSKFDIHVTALFGGGVNEQFLKPHIHYRTIWKKNIPGNSKWMKLFSPQFLHRLCVNEKYDIEVSYLEGPSARIIAGCKDVDAKLISWIHVEQHTKKKLSSSFRSFTEAKNCYEKYDQTVCVSQYVMNDFCNILHFSKPCAVLYNTVESDKILELSKNNNNINFKEDVTNLIAVGTLKKSKGYERLFSVVKRLKDQGYYIHLYILGKGPEESALCEFIVKNNLDNEITLLGYDTNPYQYVSKADIFVCTSYSEGFSTAATEALIVGTPVCTVEVSGMKEMLGEHNEYGIVTGNSEDAFLIGLRTLLDDKALLRHYQNMAMERGSSFSTTSTVEAVESMLEKIAE